MYVCMYVFKERKRESSVAISMTSIVIAHLFPNEEGAPCSRGSSSFLSHKKLLSTIN